MAPDPPQLRLTQSLQTGVRARNRSDCCYHARPGPRDTSAATVTGRRCEHQSQLLPPRPGGQRLWRPTLMAMPRPPKNLVQAASRAGVRDLVYISVLGADRMPLGYFRNKLGAEAVC